MWLEIEEAKEWEDCCKCLGEEHKKVVKKHGTLCQIDCSCYSCNDARHYVSEKIVKKFDSSKHSNL